MMRSGYSATVGVLAAAGVLLTASALSSPADPLQDQLVRAVEAVSPSVVQIETNGGLGSGVVYDGKGDVVTNAHVVGGGRLTVTLTNGSRDTATLVGAFVPDDLAVVRLRHARPRPAVFSDSSKMAVGDIVLAVGNPLGLRSSVTDGIVSSLGRTVTEGNGVALPSVIQTSASINPGNSGGALVDLLTHVVGIPTLAALDPEFGGTQAPGIGFAIPSNTVRKIADQLISHGRVLKSGRASLGVRVSTIVEGGVLVTGITPHGPSANAGIRPRDVILAVDHQLTSTTDVLVALLANLRPGQRVPVEIFRPGRRRPITVTVTLGDLAGG